MMKLFLFLFAMFYKFTTHIGGQAVMGGLIMRNYERYVLAVRNSGNEIVVERHTWYSLSKHPVLRKTFIRGFPILLETLINGIKALNRSAELIESTPKKNTPHANVFQPCFGYIAGGSALRDHSPFFAFAMEHIGLGGSIDSLSFHIWDGLFKIFLFLGYIYLISFIPEIKAVLQYHGAEHKVISCYENELTVCAENAKRCTRLHPRCGTSFILFVLLLAIIVHSIFVPLILFFPLLKNSAIMHSVVILFKIILIIPISAFAYELIRASAKRTANIFLKILSVPGLALQILTTREPSMEQLEVAVIALKEVLQDNPQNFITAPYRIIENKG